ncbi:MAG: hypothetical protein VKQ33_08795 [Candidatus Sericytochromatia bacterium]|nr:hypothetical protein [Candidatus Sericytochromatia bacterium]
MTMPITRLQQYHAGRTGGPVARPGALPAPAPALPQAPGFGQDQVSATIVALRGRIAELQQRLAAATQAAQPAYPAYPQPASPTYPQPALPTYPQPALPAYPQPGYPAYPGATGIASVMQEMASNMQRSQWETELRTRQLQQSMGQASGQMANAVNQLGYSIQSIAQSFQGLFGRR